MKKNNQKWKNKFRSSKAWKEFRTKLRHTQKVDPITGQKLTRLANLHHCDLNESHYEDLSNEDNFVFLNQMSHKVVHFFFLKSKPSEWRNRIKNIIPILEKMEALNTHDVSTGR